MLEIKPWQDKWNLKRIRRYRWHRYYKRRIILTSRKNTEEEIYFVQILLAEKWKEKSFSLVWHLQHLQHTVHGILQARILEWVAFPFSKESSQPRDWNQVSCIAGRFFTSWATRKSPRILQWVAYPFSSKSFQPRNWTQVSCIGGRCFNLWATREALTMVGKLKDTAEYISKQLGDGRMCWMSKKTEIVFYHHIFCSCVLLVN